ncbi:MAG: hypothetical protein ACOCXJ_06825, partial [Planctomycetota bacterium]
MDASDQIPAPAGTDAILERLVAVVRRTQEQTLLGAWDIGALIEEAVGFTSDGDERRLCNEYARRLAAGGYEISGKTLIAYRGLQRAYAREELPGLLEQGLSLTHLQILADLEDDLRRRIETDCYDENGRVLPVRRLRQLIQEERKQLARTASVQDAEQAAIAAAADRPLTPAGDAGRMGSGPEARVVAATAPPAEDQEDAGDSPAPDGSAPAAQETTGDGDPDAPPTVRPPGFTQSPLKVVRAADNVGIKMLGQSGDLLLALDEVARMGYDSERS